MARTLDEAKIGEDWLLPNGKFGKVGECRSCFSKVVWVRLESGKTPPFDADGASHFSTCPQAADWKGKSKVRADSTQREPSRGEADGTRGMPRG